MGFRGLVSFEKNQNPLKTGDHFSVEGATGSKELRLCAV